MSFNNKKTILFGAAIIVLAFCYVLGIRYIVSEISTGGSETSDGTKHYVAIIAKSTTSQFWQTVKAGASAASTEYNLTLSFEGPDNEEDYDTQNNMIRQAVDNGAEAIIFSAVDYNANAEEIDKAAKQGVKIVVIDSDVNSSNIDCSISTDNYEAGRMAGDAVLSIEGEEVNVGIVNFDAASANGQQREEGFREVIGNNLHINIVDNINVNSTTERAMEGTLEMLNNHPEINVIVTFNEWTSLGVGAAVEALKIGDETTVIAFDSNIKSVALLETGEVDGLIVQNPYAMGYLSVESAYNLIYGNGSKKEVNTATTLVTRENMFDPECQKMLFPFDYN